jgi:hypothetical protein
MKISTWILAALLIAGGAFTGSALAHDDWGRLAGPDGRGTFAADQHRHRHQRQHRQGHGHGNLGQRGWSRGDEHPAYRYDYRRPPVHYRPWGVVPAPQHRNR